MVAARGELLARALEMPFQEIADSPTVKYYTNWRVFQERLNLPLSQRYMDLPGWAETIDAPRVLLAGDAIIEHPYAEPVDDYKQILEQVGANGKMELYHAARLNAAVKIEYPPGSQGRLLLASLGGDAYTGHHATLILGEGSEATVYLFDLAEEGLKTFTLAVRAGPHSKLTLYNISAHGRAAVYTRRSYHAAQDAEITARIVASGGASTRLQEDYHLEGAGAKVESYISGISPSNAWTDIVLNARHAAPQTTSHIGGRGVAYEEGTLAVRGLAMVLPQAEESSSHVEVYLASLGDTARAYAVPMLEIHTGNVKSAYHSASVASLSGDVLFYLQTRGLTREEASLLIVDGILHYSGVLDTLGVPVEAILGPGR